MPPFGWCYFHLFFFFFFLQVSSWVSSVLLDVTATFGLKREPNWRTLMLEQFKFLSNILFTSTDMFIKKRLFFRKEKKRLFLFCGYIPHKYKRKKKLYFWIFIFPFCFDLVTFFSVTLTSDVLQRIVRLFPPWVWVHWKPQTRLQGEFSPAAAPWGLFGGCWSGELKGSSALSLCVFQKEHGQMERIREDYLFFLLSLG